MFANKDIILCWVPSHIGIRDNEKPDSAVTSSLDFPNKQTKIQRQRLNRYNERLGKYLDIPAVPYILNPLQCFKCQTFGNGQNTCRGRLTCARCDQFDHVSKTCQNEIACTNCDGKHFAYSRECSMWKMERKKTQSNK